MEIHSTLTQGDRSECSTTNGTTESTPIRETPPGDASTDKRLPFCDKNKAINTDHLAQTAFDIQILARLKA